MKNDSNASFVDTIPKSVLLLITIPFTVLTVYAVSQFGFLGIFKEGFSSAATLQILSDLIICALFFIAWLRNDAKVTNRNFYFWAFVTLIAGSFGPLLYLLTRNGGGKR